MVSSSTTQPLAEIGPLWFHESVGRFSGAISMPLVTDHAPFTSATGVGGSGTSIEPGEYLMTSSG